MPNLTLHKVITRFFESLVAIVEIMVQAPLSRRALFLPRVCEILVTYKRTICTPIRPKDRTSGAYRFLQPSTPRARIATYD
jgi:hypothetical protein